MKSVQDIKNEIIRNAELANSRYNSQNMQVFGEKLMSKLQDVVDTNTFASKIAQTILNGFDKCGKIYVSEKQAFCIARQMVESSIEY